MSFGGFSQSLELVDFFLKRRDAFLQIGFALREGLDLARFNLPFQVPGTELGDFTIEYTKLFARLPIQGPVGGVHHHGGVRNNVGTIVNKAIQIIALAHIPEEVFLRPSRPHSRSPSQVPRSARRIVVNCPDDKRTSVGKNSWCGQSSPGYLR